MRKLGFILMAAGILAAAAFMNQAAAFGPTGVRAAIEAANPVEPAACREKRWGWHGWGWYPCKLPPQAQTCEKCKWRWGYKYCWKVC